MWTKHAMLRVARKHGFEGKTANELNAFLDDHGIAFDGLDTPEAVAQVFNKTVTITADAGEEIIVNEPETMEGDEDVIEEKMEDDPEEKGDEYAKSISSKRARLQNGAPNHAADAMPTRKRWGDARSAKMLSYDRAVKSGEISSVTHHRRVFGDAERMEAMNAAVRMHVMGRYGYKQMRADEKILSTKDMSVGVNQTGGAFVFGQYIPEVIENFANYGAARAAAGVTPMSEGTLTMPKIAEDVTVGDIGEGDAMSSSDLLVGDVTLTAKKSYALVKVSNELFNDEAVNLEDKLMSSMMRGIRKYEDNCYFNSANNRQGLSSLVGANSTFDSDSSGWENITAADIQNFLGLCADFAAEDPNFGIAGSWQFYMKVLRNIGLSAGGTNISDILASQSRDYLNSRWSWDGLPYYINNTAPKTYTDGEIAAYGGAFSYATKIGVVTGSEEIATTDQRWFDEDKVGFRLTQRWAISCHDVNNEAPGDEAGSGVVALQS